MKKTNKKHILTRQLEQYDCGVACLSTIIRYYDGYASIEKLRELSGTTRLGTTLLGLSQAAMHCGMRSKGLKTDLKYLECLEAPCILHVTRNKMLHYVICYRYKKGKFLIGDPAEGIVSMDPEQLSKIWESKVLLQLEPSESFLPEKEHKAEKTRWLMSLIRPEIPLLILISISALIIALAGIAVSVFLQELLDSIIPAKNFNKFLIGILLVGLVLMMKSGLNYLRGKFLNIQSRDFNCRLIDSFFNNLLFLPRSFFTNRKTGELIARMDDAGRIQSAIAFIVGELVRDILIVIISFAIIFYYSVTVGLSALIFFPVFVITIMLFHRQLITTNRTVMSSGARKTSNYIDTLNGIDAITVSNKESEFSERNRQVYSFFQANVFKLGSLGLKIQVLFDFISLCLMLVVLSVSTYLVFNNRNTIGELTAMVSLVGSLLPAISNISFANIRLQGAWIALDRMYEFTTLAKEKTGEVSFKKPASQPETNVTSPGLDIRLDIIEAENVSFSFPGQKPLLREVSLYIKKGQFNLLIGRSGEGKSSIINILTRSVICKSGQITVNYEPIEKLSVKRYRDMIGVVPQELSIFNGTLLENVCLSQEEGELKKAMLFCRKHGFNIYFDRLPEALNTLLGEDGVQLSGGQKQLVALARALYRNPQLLFLDEPTSAMDSDMEHFCITLLSKIKAQIGILMISHRSDFRDIADTIFVLDKGIVSQQTPKFDFDATNAF